MLKRTIAISLLLLLSVGIYLPFADSTAHGVRQSSQLGQRRHHRYRSRAWWRRYRARLRKKRAAAELARRNTLLTLPANLNLGNFIVVPTTDTRVAPTVNAAAVAPKVAAPVAPKINLTPVALTVNDSPVATTFNAVPFAPRVNTAHVAPIVSTPRVAATVNATPVAQTIKNPRVASTVNTAPVTTTFNAAPFATTASTPRVAPAGNAAPVAPTVNVAPVLPTIRTSRVAPTTNAAHVTPTTMSTLAVGAAPTLVNAPIVAPVVKAPATTNAAVEPRPITDTKLRPKNPVTPLPGELSISVVALSRPNPAFLTAREESKLLAGVSVADLRRIVIDRMVIAGGWVTNDYVREINGGRVFVVTAKTPKDGQTPEKAWTFYFTESGGRIYGLTTDSPVEHTDRMSKEAERFIGTLRSTTVEK